ncbi:hypothetical protein MMC22_008588 [Lobaria immixta]|nr:hypothetical protein [Lobaria immixta]
MRVRRGLIDDHGTLLPNDCRSDTHFDDDEDDEDDEDDDDDDDDGVDVRGRRRLTDGVKLTESGDLQEENELNRTGPTQAKPKAKTETGHWHYKSTTRKQGQTMTIIPVTVTVTITTTSPSQSQCTTQCSRLVRNGTDGMDATVETDGTDHLTIQHHRAPRLHLDQKKQNIFGEK